MWSLTASQRSSSRVCSGLRSPEAVAGLPALFLFSLSLHFCALSFIMLRRAARSPLLRPCRGLPALPLLSRRPLQHTADGARIELGRSALPLLSDSGRLQRMTADNAHLGSVQRMREALDEKGYLFLRQIQPREKVRGWRSGRHSAAQTKNIRNTTPASPRILA